MKNAKTKLQYILIVKLLSMQIMKNRNIMMGTREIDKSKKFCK